MVEAQRDRAMVEYYLTNVDPLIPAAAGMGALALLFVVLTVRSWSADRRDRHGPPKQQS